MKFNKFDIVAVPSELLNNTEDKVGLFLHEDELFGIYVLFLHGKMEVPKTYDVIRMTDPDSSSQWGEEEINELHKLFGHNISYRYFGLDPHLITLVSAMGYKGPPITTPLNLILQSLENEIN